MLRLEHLFDRLGQLVVRDAAVDHHYALATLFEIVDVASRADLKSDLLKDLERQRSLMNGYRGNPSISEEVTVDLPTFLMVGFLAIALVADLSPSLPPPQAKLNPLEW